MAEAKMKQPIVQLGPMTPINEKKPLSHKQQEIKTAGPSVAKSGPNLPKFYLLNGVFVSAYEETNYFHWKYIEETRDQYLKLGVPLYEASIKCDWKAAKDIFDKNKELELERCSITENGETALHIAASAKVPKKVEEFVQNLVDLMEKEDLELENKNYNTALYLAAAAGNVETVKIMMRKNEKLLTIPGSSTTPQMMPIYTAALFGNHEVVQYMYAKSNDLIDDCWTNQTRGWLLEKCVENNMSVAFLI
ncbi:ankyrin repeat-containing domain, PGG domain protein, partial [Tanacetum coccineum]